MIGDRKTILVFTGLARSGKDTSAQILIDYLNSKSENTYHTYFARLLKESCKYVFGLTDEHVFGDLKEVDVEIILDVDYYFNGVLKLLQSGSLNVWVEKCNASTYALADAIASRAYLEIQRHATSYTHNTAMISPRKIMQLWGTEIIRNTVYDSAWIDICIDDIMSNPSDAQYIFITDCRFDNEILGIESAFPAPSNSVRLIKVERDDVQKVSAHASEVGVSQNYVSYVVKNNGTVSELETRLIEVLENIIAE